MPNFAHLSRLYTQMFIITFMFSRLGPKNAMETFNFKQTLINDIQLAIEQQQKDRLRALRSLEALIAWEERKKKLT